MGKKSTRCSSKPASFSEQHSQPEMLDLPIRDILLAHKQFLREIFYDLNNWRYSMITCLMLI